MNNQAELPGYARVAARLLVPSEGGPGPDLGQRKLTVDALKSALVARAERRSQRRLALALAGVAVVLLAGAGLLVLMRPTRPLARIEGGEVLQHGSRVQAGDGPVAVALSTGTRLRLNAGGRLEVAELGERQRFVLQAGSVWAKVAPLRPDQRFVLSSPDAEVEVRGTAFEVAVVPPGSACDGASTEVRVSEGVVIVRRGGRQWQVAAGQRWPRDCKLAAVPDPPAAPVAAPADVSIRRRAADARARPAPPAAPLASTLAAQNDLFAAAMDARRRGDVDQARQLLDLLLARFPFGALAETARGERAKLQP